ncbi:alkaline shock response membrane anchor protein AmaP [Actinacidiphila sp. bgisy167]|uniref:alkaline shock response membrane anchor protein AmaP n=1 Tax=Actinacidiphila sp. bgisy167 TaxID=3413797 RepID=UPI003D703A91
MRAAVNRVVLALAGLALLLVGAVVLSCATGLLRRPYSGPDDVLLSKDDRTRYADASWWWPVVLAVLALSVLCALWWLLAQVRDRTLRRVAVDADDDGVALLRGRALEEVVAADAEQLPGVDCATTLVTGTPTAPRVRLELALSPNAVPVDVLTGLDAAVLERARAGAGLPPLPAEVRLRAVTHRAARVS